MTKSLTRFFLGLICTFCLFPAVGSAQNIFAPVARVDDAVVTQFELDQRVLLMTLLNQGGDLNRIALEKLIDERLQTDAANRAGIYASEEEIQAGIDEFAGRTELSTEEFLNAISQQGVDIESFSAFVSAGIVWRTAVQTLFTPFANISDADIDREIALAGTIGSAEIQFSEIFLPTNSPENEALTLELAPQIQKLTSIDEFAEAARRFSAGESRNDGGRVAGWVRVEDLPPLIRTTLVEMKPGQVASPVEIPNALALFQLRAIREVPPKSTGYLTIDYAAYSIPGGRTPAALQRAAKIREDVDTCDDLYKIAQGQPVSVLQRETQPVSKIPRDYAIELAKLDAGESSTAITRANGQTLIFLMMCKRNRTPPVKPEEGQTQEEADDAFREGIRRQLFNKRITQLAEGYLDQLRAEAKITYP
ncbi:MAG: peptidylprolyl isomerase [Marinosulfonomonas sp.]